MSSSLLITIAVFVAAALLIILAIGFAITRLYRKVPQGRALVVSTMKAVQVSFVGRVVLPIVHKAEIMDMTVKTMTVERRGALGLVCKDNIRADIKVNFYVRVNKTEEDVIQVAQSIGCDRASDPALLAELFDAKFNEALKTVGKQMDFEDLYNERQTFRDAVVEVIGRDLNGYALDDVAIDEIEQTPVSALDPDNILDAQGIRKITEMNEDQHVQTTIASEDERKRITEKKVETDKAVLDLERERADATARQQREISVVAATEQAATDVAASEQRQRSEMARLDADQEVRVREENVNREVEIAAEHRRSAASVEEERASAEIARAVAEREALTVEAERDVESKKLDIAGIRADRVDREYSVAEQEERTLSLRVTEDARRQKDATVIAAEAAAEEQFLSVTKEAEAARTAAEHSAEAAKITATANRAAAEDQAAADLKVAEGTRATSAAGGLAEADVLAAKAEASKTEGLATVAVDAAKVDVIRETGAAEADRTRELGTAEADALRAKELAEAAGIREKLLGEAAGISEKADAMAKLEGVGQQHEEFLKKLEAEMNVSLAQVEADAEVGKVQAEAVAAAFASANIDLVGGSEEFVEHVMAAVGNGKRVDRLIESSDTLGGVLEPYVSGNGDVIAQVTDAISALGTDGLKDLAISAAVARVAKGEALGDIITGLTNRTE